jgi:hypothetical protein
MYRVECFDEGARRWYVIGGNVCRTSAHEWIAGRRAKGLRARYRVVKDTPAADVRADRERFEAALAAVAEQRAPLPAWVRYHVPGIAAVRS